MRNTGWLIFTILFSGLLIQCTNSTDRTAASTPPVQREMINIPLEVLKDKIKGGWAGQTIGVTFGGPTEFQFNGTIIQDYQPIEWYDGYIKKTMENNPGLYDDIYMDLTFVDIFEKKGLDAPVEEFANAYANAQYMLWHANQAARYNILHKVSAPQSGHWHNNPHADCIDYQIESDFAGLMSPGMPNTASDISDKIGHIMNYGDGWYGGVYVGAMYAIAFTSNDVGYVVEEALKTIPDSSHYYHVIRDVIDWHKQYPDDWKKTWFEIQNKYSEDIGCPEGVFDSFNIDATVNSAYVVLGLLYGNGDYTRTLEITTRAGQDSDCNPSTAGGVLGTIVGYDKIPDYWKQGLPDAEKLDFKYTTISLDEVYALGVKHALENIKRNGGGLDGNNVNIILQQPKPVKFEQSFAGHYPVKKIYIHKDLVKDYTFDFEGNGFVLRGGIYPQDPTSNYVAEVELLVDGNVVEKGTLPASFTTRRYELFWRYDLPLKNHTVTLRYLNPKAGYRLQMEDVIVYSNQAPKTKS